MWAEVGVDIEACGGLVSCDDGNRFASKFPSMTRDTGAEILDLVLKGETRLRDSMEFIEDSLFCEWVYIVNLDTEMLEVYKGFQREPHKQGRYASKKAQREVNENSYYPCALVAEFSFKGLPTEASFVAQLSDVEEEEAGLFEETESACKTEAIGRVESMAGKDVQVKRMLADLRHYCEASGIDFSSESRKAGKLYKRECQLDG